MQWPCQLTINFSRVGGRFFPGPAPVRFVADKVVVLQQVSLQVPQFSTNGPH
jgi:hypothetical protein